jgi:SAM-dependent methyltransferase
MVNDVAEPRKIVIKTHEDVYEPADDTELLVRSLRLRKGERILEIGTGTGVVAIHCAKLGCRVTATDLLAPAIALARENADANGVALELLEGGGRRFPLVDAQRRRHPLLHPASRLVGQHVPGQEPAHDERSSEQSAAGQLKAGCVGDLGAAHVPAAHPEKVARRDSPTALVQWHWLTSRSSQRLDPGHSKAAAGA